MDAQKEDLFIDVIHRSSGFEVGCLGCMTVIASGYFAIQVQVGAQYYLLGVAPPITHCGEAKEVPVLCMSKEDALVHAEKLRARLEESGTTAGVPLLEQTRLTSTTPN